MLIVGLTGGVVLTIATIYLLSDGKPREKKETARTRFYRAMNKAIYGGD